MSAEKKEELNTYIKRRRYTLSALSRDIGLSRQSLHNKMNGINDFTLTDIICIQKALGLSDKEVISVFFG